MITNVSNFEIGNPFFPAVGQVWPAKIGFVADGTNDHARSARLAAA
jgi:hypothetical protein